MANPLFVRTGIVAGLGTVAVLMFFAAATGALPIRALLARVATQAQPATIPAEAPVTPVASAVEKVALVAPTAKGPSLTDNDVVAGSFAALPAQLQKPALADGTKAVESAVTAPLTKRTVQVIAVKPDGTPDLSALPSQQNVAQAYVEPHRPPVRPEIPALDAAEKIGAGEPPADTVSEAPKSVASIDPVAPAAKSGGASATILGSGANVRSAPSKGNNKVLFALAGGTSVKVGESKNGWLRITDAKGRTGWVYKDYVKR